MIDEGVECPKGEKKYSGRKATNFWPNMTMDVDYELKEEWLDRLNSVEGVEVVHSCAGHGDERGESRFSQFAFVLAPPLTGKDTLVSDAMSFAASISGRVDAIVRVAVPYKKDPNLWHFEIMFDHDRVKLKEAFGPVLERFVVGDARLSELAAQLDRWLVSTGQHKEDPFYWARPVIYVTSKIIHKASNHNAIDKWWPEALAALEAAYEG